MTKRLELEGQRFGRLVARHLTGEAGNSLKWLCHCDCGNTTSVSGSRLKSGWTHSCGCLQREAAKEVIGLNRPLTPPAFKHGLCRTPLARVWYGMINRCENTGHTKYKYWGGKGVAVCKEWREDFLKFKEWADGQGWKKGMQLDRKDNDGDYSPDNCHFLTKAEHSAKTMKERWGK